MMLTSHRERGVMLYELTLALKIEICASALLKKQAERISIHALN